MRVDGLDLHVSDHGTGSPVVLLHGWPDSSYLWRSQISALNEAGFRAVAPDLRGFGRSDKPDKIDDYSFRTITADILGIMDQLGIESAHIVGHDWGAALAWGLAIRHPDRVNRLVVLSVPHPAVPRNLEQHEKFWYQLLFMFEGVAEAWLQDDDWALFRQFMRNNGDMERYLADLSRPGALTASLGIYRANVRPRLPALPGHMPRVTAPTLALWSSGDHYLVESRVVASEQFVAAPWRYERIDGASHWIPIDAPERLNRLLLEWLG